MQAEKGSWSIAPTKLPQWFLSTKSGARKLLKKWWPETESNCRHKDFQFQNNGFERLRHLFNNL